MTQNKLQLNIEKTEAMLTGTGQNLPSISVNTCQLDDLTVPLSDCQEPQRSLRRHTVRGELYQSNRQILLLPALSNEFCPEVSFHRGYSETGSLTHSVTPRLLQFSPFWPTCFLCP